MELLAFRAGSPAIDARPHVELSASYGDHQRIDDAYWKIAFRYTARTGVVHEYVIATSLEFVERRNA